MDGKLGAMAGPEAPVLPALVLLVEDNPGDAELVLAYLDAAPQLSLTVVPRLLKALECVEGESIDCILLDLDLPDADGLDGLKRLLEAAPTIPVVVLTGLNDAGIGGDAMRLGAQDYLVKNQLNAGVLAGAVRYAMERQRQHVALGDAYSRLEREVRDRRRAEDLLRRQTGELSQAKERFQKAFDHAPIGMAITGLDGRFREVNPAFSEMLGYEPAELLERSLSDVGRPDGVHPDQPTSPGSGRANWPRSEPRRDWSTATAGRSGFCSRQRRSTGLAPALHLSVRGHHGAQASGGSPRSSGTARCPHRSAEPGSVPGSSRAGVIPHGSKPRRAWCAVP